MDFKKSGQSVYRWIYIVLFVAVCAAEFFVCCYNFYMMNISPLAPVVPEQYTGAEYVCDVPEDSVPQDSFGNKIQSMVSSVIGSLNAYAKTHSLFPEEFTELGAYLKRESGLSLEFAYQGESSITRTQDGMLIAPVPECDPSLNISQVIGFSEYLREQDIPFLFFETLFKYDEQKYDGFYEDHSQERIRRVIDALRNAGISVVSVTEESQRQGLDNLSLFFKTDHHWLPQTGIWANKLLCEAMNKDFGCQFDLSAFEMENYDVKILEDALLGSLGQQATVHYADMEDFPVVIPKYDTDLTVFNSYDSSTKTGPVQQVLLNEAILEKNIQTRDLNKYPFYGYGDMALIRIQNNRISNGSHVLMLKTSFANVMYPYLAAEMERLDVIDLRAFKGSLRAYIQETDPDVVVMVYGATSFGDSVQTDAFDFS